MERKLCANGQETVCSWRGGVLIDRKLYANGEETVC